MKAPYDFFNYRRYWKNRSYEDESERIALEYFLRIVPKKGKIVDIGGGFGRLCTTYANIFEECVVLDPSEKNIDEGKKIFDDIKNVIFKKGELPSLEFEDNTFDTALLIRVIHHLETPLPSFKEIARILKKNGYLIIETANKIHFMARIKSFFKGDFNFTKDLSPVEKRSPESIKEGKITFLNHHPLKIINDLREAGFKIEDSLSVSNFRSSLFKMVIPERILVFLEKKVQKPFSKIFFGPSIFFLCQKK